MPRDAGAVGIAAVYKAEKVGRVFVCWKILYLNPAPESPVPAIAPSRSMGLFAKRNLRSPLMFWWPLAASNPYSISSTPRCTVSAVVANVGRFGTATSVSGGFAVAVGGFRGSAGACDCVCSSCEAVCSWARRLLPTTVRHNNAQIARAAPLIVGSLFALAFVSVPTLVRQISAREFKSTQSLALTCALSCAHA